MTEPVGVETVTEVKISAKNLKQHANGNGKMGYWVGFAPNAALTRGMFVTVLYRMAGEPETAAQNFADVAAGQYYEKAIAWANATRAEAAAVFVRALEKLK